MTQLKFTLQLLLTLVLLAAFMGCAAAQKQPRTGRDVDDAVITSQIKAMIFAEASLNTLPIHVRTADAIVQLSGFVDSARSVTRAGEVAGRIDGVVSVKNDLVVQY